MKGKVTEMNKTDAFITFGDGTTMNISVSSLPQNTRIGDDVNIPFSTPPGITNSAARDRMVNNKIVDFF
ncbi:hypothetical protein [Clostridium polynesiense]|uniref:hypothetical protein n=1 Tax=Clostridium polynesiense TaxID=1325933 RepID=UPI00058C116E|nr:hypothetical protein [Clostridium polynesiense]